MASTQQLLELGDAPLAPLMKRSEAQAPGGGAHHYVQVDPCGRLAVATSLHGDRLDARVLPPAGGNALTAEPTTAATLIDLDDNLLLRHLGQAAEARSAAGAFWANFFCLPIAFPAAAKRRSVMGVCLAVASVAAAAVATTLLSPLLLGRAIFGALLQQDLQRSVALLGLARRLSQRAERDANAHAWTAASAVRTSVALRTSSLEDGCRGRRGPTRWSEEAKLQLNAKVAALLPQAEAEKLQDGRALAELTAARNARYAQIFASA